MILIDGTDQVLGRMATQVAKKLISGEEVVIINAEKVIISGSKKAVFEEYTHKFSQGGLRKGPFYPRSPDRIVRRAIRGMLAYDKPHGKEAFKRLKVYIGTNGFNPKDSILKPMEEKDKPYRYVYVGDISRHLGSSFNVIDNKTR